MGFDTNAARYQLEDLARENGIEITWIQSWLKAVAFVEARMVDIPEPITRPDYMVGLHEFGHVLAGPDELAAWRWAHAHDRVG